MDAINGGSLQASFICQVIVKPLNIRFLYLGNFKLPKLRPNKGIIHILVVLEGVILKPSLNMTPEIKKLVDGRVSLFGLYAVRNITVNFLFFRAEFFKRFTVDNVPLSKLIGPPIVIATVRSLAFPLCAATLAFEHKSNLNM